MWDHDDQATAGSRPKRLGAILHQRCPRCFRGQVFSGKWTMNRSCPVCGLEFQREPGYFLGAMYFSYALALPALGILSLVVHWLRPGWPLHWVLALAWLAFLPLVPAIFRSSRVIFMHFDRWIDPGP